MAVVSGIIDWISAFHTHVFQLIVAIKHLVPDGCHAFGYSDMLQTVATIKCTGPDRLEVRGKSDKLKPLTKYKFTAI